MNTCLHYNQLLSLRRNRVFLIAVSAQCLLAVIESSSDSVYALWFATPLNLGKGLHYCCIVYVAVQWVEYESTFFEDNTLEWLLFGLCGLF